ncbi:MAG: imidazole glycerol phosphate synthase subunit HisH [Cenarchaeum symbiont of Oopsacas minuta]|nr:imidazole glycerol phosphate synthase subunit HisH [Cenarchaeum symbiont of Oopsacas minuta]
MSRVAIFDYGASNIFSLKNALERCGAKVIVIDDLKDTSTISGLLLPGVGNFDPAVRSICGNSEITFKERIGASIPVLGICLGMEMYFEHSQEGKEPGFAAMKGEVILLPNMIKVPHMGWNNLETCGDSKLLSGINDKKIWAYFVHSYYTNPKDPRIVTATTDYGIKVPAIVESGLLYGTQFHPEKSGHVGKIILENFLRECQK